MKKYFTIEQVNFAVNEQRKAVAANDKITWGQMLDLFETFSFVANRDEAAVLANEVLKFGC